MKKKKFAYGRVSSKGQNEARQLEAFKKYGIDERDIYIDKKSGKDFERDQYQLLKNNLREGDLLVIHSIDRLGRNYEMIVNEWKDITKNIKADIVVLDMPLLDTRQKKDLLGTFINDLILGILSYNYDTTLFKIYIFIILFPSFSSYRWHNRFRESKRDVERNEKQIFNYIKNSIEKDIRK